MWVNIIDVMDNVHQSSPDETDANIRHLIPFCRKETTMLAK